MGIKYLLKTLSKNGRGDVALMIMQQRTPPSYIYMVEQGATTMWETWTGTEYLLWAIHVAQPSIKLRCPCFWVNL